MSALRTDSITPFTSGAAISFGLSSFPEGISGSLNVSGSFTGTLSGTASNADLLDNLDSSYFRNASNITGILSVSNGGLGTGTLTANNVILGNGTSPVQTVAPGSSGSVLTSDGTIWKSATPAGGGITNIVTATGNTTLTSTPTLLRITPTNYGTTVKLPDATTMTVGAGKFEIENLSTFHVRIANNSGTLLGFVDAYDSVQIDLTDASTSAGVWTVGNVMRLGISALSASTTTTENFVTAGGMSALTSPIIELDADRCFLLRRNSSGALYGVVYDQSTNTFGSETLIRNAATTNAGVCKVDSNKVVVASNVTTAFEAVTITISGTTITVHTAATTTLPATTTNFYGFLKVPSGGYVYVHSSSTSSYLTPVDVSGTTTSIGTINTTTWTNNTNVNQSCVQVAADKILFHHGPDANLIAYSLSGTTITAGSKTATGQTTNGTTILAKMSDTTFFFNAQTSAAGSYVGVASLSGTTITVYLSTAILSGGSLATNYAHVISSTKVAFNVASSNNILTYTAGVGVSLGTPISGSPIGGVPYLIRGSSSELAINSSNVFVLIDVSGSSPTFKSFFQCSSSTLPTTEQRTGLPSGLLTSDIRVENITQGTSIQPAFSLYSLIILRQTGNVNGTPIVPIESSKFGWLNNTGGAAGRSMYRKYELV